MDWDKIRADAAAILDQPGLTQTAAWSGKTIYGVRTTLKRQDVNTDAGLIGGRYQFSLLCALAQFAGALPEPRRDKMTIEGVSYRVLAVESDAIGATVRIHLGDNLA